MEMKITRVIYFNAIVIMLANIGAGCEGCAESIIVGDAGGEDDASTDPAREELAGDEIAREEEAETTTDPAHDELVEDDIAHEEEAETSMSYWSRTYCSPTSPTTEGISIQLAQDSGFIVLGHLFYSEDFTRDFWILKLDETGTTIWEKSYGGDGDEIAYSIQQVPDGGYIVVGRSGSFVERRNDIWLLRLNSGGDIVWQKSIGGPADEMAYSVQTMPDGGYVVAGFSESFNRGEVEDLWIFKLDGYGDMSWQKFYGGPETDVATDLKLTLDGNLIVVGSSDSFGTDDRGNGGIWILKLDPEGNAIWQKLYREETRGGMLYSIQPTSDYGYISIGSVGSAPGENADVMIAKLDEDGVVVWQKLYGGDREDYGYSIQETSDGGFIAAGYSDNSTGDRKGWILKLDMDGHILWQKSYLPRMLNSILQVPTGGFIAVGRAYCPMEPHGSAWVMKLDDDGYISESCIGENTDAVVTEIALTAMDTSISPVDSNAHNIGTPVIPVDTLFQSQILCGR